MKRIVAITGGIGSGKSAVLGFVKDMGFQTLSADDANRRLLCDPEYLSRLEELFPDAFIGGVFDRAKLADTVFNDDNERLKLNSLAHGCIGDIIRREIDRVDGVIFVEVPLLIESGLIDIFDDIIVVTSPKSVRVKRVEARDGVCEDKVLKRMNVQTDDETLASFATYVIENDSTLDELREKVTTVKNSIVQKM